MSDFPRILLIQRIWIDRSAVVRFENLFDHRRQSSLTSSILGLPPDQKIEERAQQMKTEYQNEPKQLLYPRPVAGHAIN
jgi:hypothetical protein